MGGTDDPSNLIELTVEEHALAHKKLYEEHGNQEDFMAWHMLLGQMGKDEALLMSRSIGGKKPMSEESKAKLRESCRLRTERQRADGTLERANKKRSLALKGKKKSNEAVAAWKESRMNNGKPWHSEETCKKIAEGGKGNKNASKD